MPRAASKYFVNNKTLKCLDHTLVRFESWIGFQRHFQVVQPVGECHCWRGFLVIHFGFFTCYYVGILNLSSLALEKLGLYFSLRMSECPGESGCSGLEICKAQQIAVFSRYLSAKTRTRSVTAPPERLTMVLPILPMCYVLPNAGTARLLTTMLSVPSQSKDSISRGQS